MRAFLGLVLGGAKSCPRSGVGDCFLLDSGIERSESMLVFAFPRLCTDGRKSSKKAFYLVFCHQTVVVPRPSKLANEFQVLIIDSVPRGLHFVFSMLRWQGSAVKSRGPKHRVACVARHHLSNTEKSSHLAVQSWCWSGLGIRRRCLLPLVSMWLLVFVCVCSM